MIVLVDFDNIPELERSPGPKHVTRRILGALGNAAVQETEIRIRFYGGWFQGPTLTRRAQQLLPALSADFPTTVAPPAGPSARTIIVRAELALALVASPSQYLTHTYRERAVPRNVRCAHLPYSGCQAPGACPLSALHALIRDRRCPEPGCAVDLDSVLTKPEQKLVDTMLTVDLLHLARTTTETITVVSDDDDIWPGILAALQFGARIVHVHPLPGWTTPTQYSSLVTGSYSQANF